MAGGEEVWDREEGRLGGLWFGVLELGWEGVFMRSLVVVLLGFFCLVFFYCVAAGAGDVLIPGIFDLEEAEGFALGQGCVEDFEAVDAFDDGRHDCQLRACWIRSRDGAG